MAALVTVNSGRAGSLLTLSAIPVTIDANGATYTAASGGLPVDLYGAVSVAGPFSAPIKSTDILGVILISAAGYVVPPGTFAIGSVTSSSIPVTFKLFNGTTQFSDGACTQVMTGWVLVARGGSN